MSLLSALWIGRAPAAGLAAIGVFWGAFAGSVPVLKDRLGTTDGAFGLLLLGSGLGLVSGLRLAPLVDRVLGERAVQGTAALFALVWTLPGLAPGPVAFFLSLLLVGLASGLLDIAANARVSELEAHHHRSLMNGVHGMFAVAYAASAALTGLLREAGWAPAGTMAVFAAATLLLLVPAMRQPIEAHPPPPGGTGRVPLWPLLAFGGLVLLAYMTEATVEAWGALHVERTLGGRAAEGALGPAVLGLTLAAGRLSGQVMTGRLNERTMIVSGSLLATAGALTAAVAPSPGWAYLGFGAMGLGVSVIGPMGLALLGHAVPPYLRAAAIGRAAVMGFSGLFFAPVLMGLASEAWGLRVAYGLVAVLILAAAPLSRVKPA